MVIFILPEYIEGKGDCCRVCTESGEMLLTQNIRSQMNLIFRDHMRDLKSIRKRCSSFLSQSYLTPLYLSEREVLLPFKTRESRITNDSHYGYVNYESIVKYKSGCLILSGGRSIGYYENDRIVSKRMNMARNLKEHFIDIEKSGFDYSEDMTQPATRGDIARIMIEIGIMKRTMERSI